MTTEAAAELYKWQHVVDHEGIKAVAFNPKSLGVDELPYIYVFSGMKHGGDGICYAIAQDGHALGSHWCSHEAYAPHDLGVLENCRGDRHETSYKKHYPDGYRMRFVPAKDVETHEGLNKALELNSKLRPENER